MRQIDCENMRLGLALDLAIDSKMPRETTPGLSSMGGGSFLERVGKRDGKMPTAGRIASAGKCPVRVKGAPLF